MSIDVHSTRRDLAMTLVGLPYAEYVDGTLRDTALESGDEREFLVEIIAWLRAYRRVDGAAKTSAVAMRGELTRLRTQIAAVRSLFGTDQTGTP